MVSEVDVYVEEFQVVVIVIFIFTCNSAQLKK